MIKTILWDMDGTLLDFLASQSVSMKKTYKHFGLGECSDELVETYSNINNKYWLGLERGDYTKEQVLLGRFEEFLGMLGVTSVTPKEYCAYYESHLPDTIVYVENSFDVIKKLSLCYNQYVVTNGAYNVQVKKLDKSGFDKLFNGVFISDTVGFEKPSKQFFDYVLERIEKTPLDEILIVGDSLTSDIKGGNNIGIKTCWYNPNHKQLDKDVTVDYEIHTLNEIFDILK